MWQGKNVEIDNVCRNENVREKYQSFVSCQTCSTKAIRSMSAYAATFTQYCFVRVYRIHKQLLSDADHTLKWRDLTFFLSFIFRQFVPSVTSFWICSKRFTFQHHSEGNVNEKATTKTKWNGYSSRMKTLHDRHRKCENMFSTNWWNNEPNEPTNEQTATNS